MSGYQNNLESTKYDSIKVSGICRILGKVIPWIQAIESIYTETPQDVSLFDIRNTSNPSLYSHRVEVAVCQLNEEIAHVRRSVIREKH